MSYGVMIAQEILALLVSVWIGIGLLDWLTNHFNLLIMKTLAEIEREVKREFEIEERNVKICIGIIIAGCLMLSLIPFL